ncbi:NAD(P)-binding protein [uncultured Shewanella sp.]|uniref:NAD(P)-binding protein n=1 Tax=uncultured Shewanella sp. TaxID=173975 RepID=UPI00260D2B36|nr:NAD(P)-binding protein [uncultured Shewanella sp.]
MLKKQKIAIIGGGVAGLSSAWLLDEHHDITLYETSSELGGDAKTFKRKGIAFDYGFRTVCCNYTYFKRLLKILDVPTVKRPFNVLYQNEKHSYLTPFLSIHGNLLSKLNLRYLKTIIAMKKFVCNANIINESVTVEEYALHWLKIDTTIYNEVILPLFCSAWSCTVNDFRQFSAKIIANFLFEVGLSKPFPPKQTFFTNGCSEYINKLHQDLNHTQVILNTPVQSVTFHKDYWVVKTNETTHQYDLVIFAIPANKVCAIIESDEIKAIFNPIRYSESSVVIHNDLDIVGEFPPRTTYKYIYNQESPFLIGHYLPHPNEKIFITYRVDDNLFKTDKVFFSRTFQHVIIDKELLNARDQIKQIQGLNNLYFTGAYLVNEVLHESALNSTMNIITMICPESKRLKSLTSI